MHHEIDDQLLVGAWTHSFEEDEGERLVFRPADRDFPPARRARRTYHIGADGSLGVGAPGPDDRTVVAPGSWAIDGRQLAMYPTAGSPLLFTVEELEPDRLVLRPRHSDTT